MGRSAAARPAASADGAVDTTHPAAAVLLPSKVVGQAIWSGKSATTLADDYGTSVELAEMRIKTLNLWPDYKKQGA